MKKTAESSLSDIFATTFTLANVAEFSKAGPARTRVLPGTEECTVGMFGTHVLLHTEVDWDTEERGGVVVVIVVAIDVAGVGRAVGVGGVARLYNNIIHYINCFEFRV